MVRSIPNILTGCRIFCSVLMLCFPVFSTGFLVLYLLCGVSDMADGAAARYMNCASESGAKFDTLADLIFVAAALVKFLPAVPVPGWLWAWIAVIAAIRIGCLVAGSVCGKTLFSLHTGLNKVTGMLLFLLPLTLRLIALEYSAVVVCTLATAAAVQEGRYIKAGRKSARFSSE